MSDLLVWETRSSLFHGDWEEAGHWRIQYRSYKDQSGFYLMWGKSKRMHDYPLILSEAKELAQQLQDVLDLSQKKSNEIPVIDYGFGTQL